MLKKASSCVLAHFHPATYLETVRLGCSLAAALPEAFLNILESGASRGSGKGACQNGQGLAYFAHCLVI
jgi:hypothetical protein